MLTLCIAGSLAMLGASPGEGAEMPDTYHKDPQAVARLTPTQYQVTQEGAT